MHIIFLLVYYLYNNFKWCIINTLGCDRRCLFHIKFSGIGFISITTRLDAIITKHGTCYFYHHATGCHYNKTRYLLFLLSSTLLATIGMEHRATVRTVPTWPMAVQSARALERKR